MGDRQIRRWLSLPKWIQSHVVPCFTLLYLYPSILFRRLLYYETVRQRRPRLLLLLRLISDQHKYQPSFISSADERSYHFQKYPRARSQHQHTHLCHSFCQLAIHLCSSFGQSKCKHLLPVCFHSQILLRKYHRWRKHKDLNKKIATFAIFFS